MSILWEIQTFWVDYYITQHHTYRIAIYHCNPFHRHPTAAINATWRWCRWHMVCIGKVPSMFITLKPRPKYAVLHFKINFRQWISSVFIAAQISLTSVREQLIDKDWTFFQIIAWHLIDLTVGFCRVLADRVYTNTRTTSRRKSRYAIIYELCNRSSPSHYSFTTPYNQGRGGVSRIWLIKILLPYLLSVWFP